MYGSCGRMDRKREQPMIYPGEPIEYALRERGYEWELRDGLYVFRKVIDQNDISRALEDCFGKGRKEFYIRESALNSISTLNNMVISIEALISWLDRVDWE